MTEAATPTILMMDDDEPFCRLVEESFADEPYRLVLARDAAEALDIAHREHPVLAILGGEKALGSFKVCRQLKEGEDTRSIPIVLVCSGSEKEEEVLKGFQVGADDLLRKPLSVAYLKTKIRVWVARAGRAG